MTTPSEPTGTPETQPANGPANTAPTNPAPVTPAPAPANPPAQTGNTFGHDLKTSIDALPEKIISGLREAMQPANPPKQETPKAETASTQTSTDTNAATTSQPATTEPGKKRSFGDWWFGS